jgi:hypothetical protein
MNKLPKNFTKLRRKNLTSNQELAKIQNPSLPSKNIHRFQLPTAKYSHKEQAGQLAHHLLSIALPITVYLLVAFFQLYYIALGLILASKWQIFLVKPRFWWANLKFSAVDLIFKLGILLLLIQAELKTAALINKSSLALHIFQVLLAAIYLFWNLYLRKLSNPNGMRAQSLVAQTIGLIALGWASGFATSTVPLPLILAGTWLIAYSAAQHALYAYEESSIHQLASFWALFATTLSFLQDIWAKNFILFSSLIYLPLMPFVIAGFGYLATQAHALIEQQQDETELPAAVLNKKKAELTRQASATFLGCLFLAILIVLH